MEMLQIGPGELLTIFVETAFILAFPVGLLFLLYKIYLKLRSIDEHLKKQ